MIVRCKIGTLFPPFIPLTTNRIITVHLIDNKYNFDNFFICYCLLSSGSTARFHLTIFLSQSWHGVFEKQRFHTDSGPLQWHIAKLFGKMTDAKLSRHEAFGRWSVVPQITSCYVVLSWRHFERRPAYDVRHQEVQQYVVTVVEVCDDST